MPAGLDLAVTLVDATVLELSCADSTIDGGVTVSFLNRGLVDVVVPFELLVFQDDAASSDGLWTPGVDTELGRATYPASPAAPLPVGEAGSIVVPVVGTQPFRGSPLFAVIDPGGVAGVDLEPSNDVLDTATSCTIVPVLDDWTPVIEWRVEAPATLPTHVEVDTTPLVGDVDADGWPDVAAAFAVAEFDAGVVRLLDGRDGSEHWVAADPLDAVYSSSNLALGELDGDPGLEIVAQSHVDPRTLVVIDHDGAHLGTTPGLSADHPPLNQGGGAPALGDLDADGQPEIVFGKSAFNTGVGLGTAFWIPDPASTDIGANNAGAVRDGAVSVLADVSGDGLLDVVAGSTVYRFNAGTGVGEVLWQQPLVPDGYPAVGNFDADPAAEIVLVADGEVILLEGESGAIAWRETLPVGGGGCTPVGPIAGGPPLIADVDADCAPEVSVTGANTVVVLETDGSLLWQVPLDDCTGHRMPVSAFDFEGDGAAELVVLDETSLRVLDGRSGSALLIRAAAGHGWLGGVSIADVDADASAELVVPLSPCDPANPLCDAARQALTGIELLGHADGRWASTRRTWNQHSYHVDNVNDDGTIPRVERSSWAEHGSYRVQLSEAPTAAPNLTLGITSLELEVDDCGSSELVAMVRVGNAGSSSSVVPTEARWYLQERPSLTWLGSSTVADLASGDYVDLTFRLPTPRFGEMELLFCIDEDPSGAERGVLDECNEDDNCCLGVIRHDVVFIPNPPRTGNSLRPAAVSHGDPLTENWVEFTWDGDEGAPREDGFEYRLRRAGDPIRLYETVTPPGWQLTRFRDDPPPLAERPYIWFYRLFAADRCGFEEDGWPLP